MVKREKWLSLIMSSCLRPCKYSSCLLLRSSACFKLNDLVIFRYDGGCSFKFPLRDRTFRVEVRLCGSILEEQYYTYHLYLDDRPALPSGAPGTLPSRFQEAVNLMKALQPKCVRVPAEQNTLKNENKSECVWGGTNQLQVTFVTRNS